MVSHANIVEMKELFARIVHGRFGFLDVPATAPTRNSDQVGHRAVEIDNQDTGQTIFSAKRRHNICPVDQDDTSVDGQENKDRKPKRPKMESSQGQKLVCPYMKHDPIEYSKSRTCHGPGFDGINRLK
jgi:hypothetical protein